MEKLHIQGFGGMKDCQVEFLPITIITGPHSSGKSLQMKLRYFFRNIFSGLLKSIIERKSKAELESEFTQKFKIYFPEHAWRDNYFLITYQLGGLEIIAQYSENSPFAILFNTKLSELIQEITNYVNQTKSTEQESGLENNPIGIQEPWAEYSLIYKQRKRFIEIFRNNTSNSETIYQQFIPSERGLVSFYLNNIFTLLRNNLQNNDAFLVDFAQGVWLNRMTDLERIKIGQYSYKDLYCNLLKAQINSSETTISLLQNDGRKVDLSIGSSAQQSLVPLLILLGRFIQTFDTLENDGIVLYIEEPEAHLFPNQQYELIKIISLIYNVIPNCQICISTHSNYVITAINNLMTGGWVASLSNGSEKTISAVKRILAPGMPISPESITAWYMNDGRPDLIIENNLINFEGLDAAGEQIINDFNEILDLYDSAK